MIQFIKNAWYVAGFTREFDEQLRRFTILDEHIVMFRRSDGQIAALDGRCPHRLLPLSKGKRIGDTVQCGYHGLTFDCSGKCTRVPGQDNLPASAYVHAYPTHSRHGITWVWMGDVDKADPGQIFDLPEFAEDKEILEAVQEEEARPQKRRPIRIAIDKAPLVYRKRINDLLELERTEDLASDPSPAFVYHD